jgi:hypothetical protein
VESPLAVPSLYHRVLGAQFESLPIVLQRFHDAPGGGRARGEFQVERTSGWLRRGLASVLRMPKEAMHVPVSLEVKIEGDRERWVRHFDGRRMETVQWASAGLLMESFAHTMFSSKLVVDGSWLRHEFQRAWLFGVPLPRFLSPYVEGTVNAGEDGWQVEVRISAPFLGELVHYGGWMSPD